MASFHTYTWGASDTLLHVAGAFMTDAGYTDVATLIGLIMAQNPDVWDWNAAPPGYVPIGGLPLVTAGSLTVQQPATQAVQLVAGLPRWITAEAQSLALPPSSDVYVDLTLGGQYVGSPVTVGAGQPSLQPYAVRLYVATTSDSGVAALTPLAPIGIYGPNTVMVGQRVTLPFNN